MESEETTVTNEIRNGLQDGTESSENFQKFIYQLFEKNGVMNDLRTYLRGQIVNVLKSAQKGDPPACQNNFTQRLQPTVQAINILIVEYMLRMEFNYSLSVFVSDIPLANMVFDFARVLLQSGSDDWPLLRFKESDVWAVLNYLGVKFDSEHVSSIVEMYKKERSASLLFCILSCVPMYTNGHNYIEQCHTQIITTEDSSSSHKSSESVNSQDPQKSMSWHKCRHQAFCKTCQHRIQNIREKYKRKKRTLIKQETAATRLSGQNVEKLMKNITYMERSLVDEMFQQLKSVYEGEVAMVKAEQEEKIKQSLAYQDNLFKKRRREMEEEFKAREEELERNVQQKKKFLWGLARALREQHSHMSLAMENVRIETQRLTAKEYGLKSQLIQAEEVLRTRGSEMRSRVSDELAVLEGYLDSINTERENIKRERDELEELKTKYDNTSQVIKMHNLDENESLRPHYELVKNELSILKKCMESTNVQPKSVIDSGTLTELNDVTTKLTILMNNEKHTERNSSRDEDRGVKTPNQLVNDLKKAKNVNFSQSNLDELYRERSRERSRSSLSSEAGDAGAGAVGGHTAERDRESEGIVRRLHDENERLKSFARQQREHIDSLSSQQARLQAELTASRAAFNTGAYRPRTAPAVMARNNFLVHSVYPTSSANTLGWRKGAGEELSLFSNAQPRILVPGDTLPFIGVLRDRHGDNRRHLISQWRALRKRISSHGGVSKVRCPVQGMDLREIPVPDVAGPSTVPAQHSPNDDVTIQRPCNNVTITYQCNVCNNKLENRSSAATLNCNKRTRSPRALLKETREKLRSSETCYQHPNPTLTLCSFKRPKSPKSVLKETKERLKSKVKAKDSPILTREKSPNSVLHEAKLRLRKLEIEAEAVENSYLDFRKRQSGSRGETTYLGNDKPVTNKDTTGLVSKKIISFPKLLENYRSDTTSFNEACQSARTEFDKFLLEYQTKLDIGNVHFKNRNATAEKVQPIPNAYSIKNEHKEMQNDNYIETPIVEFRKLYQSHKTITQEERPTTSPMPIDNIDASAVEENENKSRKKEQIKVVKNKKAEFDILRSNILKMYNLKENHDTDTSSVPSCGRAVDEDILNLEAIQIKEESENVLRIEVVSVNEMNKINASELSHPELSVVVQSTVDHTEISRSDQSEGEEMSGNMIILISPKTGPQAGNNIELDMKPLEQSLLNVSPKVRRRKSPEKRTMTPRETERMSSETKTMTPQEKGSMSPEDRGTMTPEERGGLSPEDKRSMSPQTRGSMSPDDRRSMSPRARGSMSPEDRRSMSPRARGSMLPEDRRTMSPQDRRSISPEEIRIPYPQEKRKVFPEQAAKLTRNDVLDAIFHRDDIEAASSFEMQFKTSRDGLEYSISEVGRYAHDDYTDDFSADVDNYNSPNRSDDDLSPISHLKTSEDEDFSVN